MTHRVERSALVPFSQEQMFDLVNDIESYPRFMSGCVGAEVLERGDGWVRARLDLAKAGLKQSFVTRNELVPPQSMRLHLVSGPFKRFDGEWRFEALDETACKVIFWLEFEFRNRLLALAATKVFEHIASEQVDALAQRARSVYRAD